MRLNIFFNILLGITALSVFVINFDIFSPGSKTDLLAFLGLGISHGGSKVIKRKDTIPELTEKLHFLPSYRNPCWLETDVESKAILRCLPHYYVIGVPKCGTTDLCRRINMHPLISNKVVKGNHWLSRFRYGKFPELSNYLQLFENAVNTDIKRITTADGYHSAIFGDCSPSTSWNSRHMFYEAKRQNKTEEPGSNAEVLKHLNPKSKIIAILRNPVERLYSEYLFFNGNQNNPEEFHRRVIYSVNNMTLCMQNNTLRTCVYFLHRRSSFRKIDKVRLQVGIYHVFLEDFMNAFPRDQIFIIKMEKYSTQIKETLQKVFSFLDVGNITDPELLKNISTRARANTRSGKNVRVGDMLPETRKLLSDFYKPFNERLKELLGNEFDYNQS